MSHLEKRHLFVPAQRQASPVERILHETAALALAPLSLAFARMTGMPGISEHLRCAALALRRYRQHAPMSLAELHQLAFAPFDSVRYFEFGYLLGCIARQGGVGRYLDVSSPRLFVALVLQSHACAACDVINPDRRDLEETKRVLGMLGLAERCVFRPSLVADAAFAPETFDTISSVSVIEHIAEDRNAIERIWSWLRSGGRLYVSVPCARWAFAEYQETSEYGLLPPEPDGSHFLQRFYDEQLLRERVWSVTGEPASMSIFGERSPGLYERIRQRKLRTQSYPYYLESYFMASSFQRFASFQAMPGVGVVAMEFRKP
jgi:SAM-dependent methyltransferase